MGFKVKYSEQAATDLSDIISYICDNLNNPVAAERFYNEVDKRLGYISDNPYMYALHHDENLSAMGYRFVSIGNYLMFYTVDDECKTASIARIVYGRRTLSEVFGNSDD